MLKKTLYKPQGKEGVARANLVFSDEKLQTAPCVRFFPTFSSCFGRSPLSWALVWSFATGSSDYAALN